MIEVWFLFPSKKITAKKNYYIAICMMINNFEKIGFITTQINFEKIRNQIYFKILGKHFH